MTPSDVLVREATSSTPPVVSWVLIVWVAAVVGIRQLILVDRRPVDTAVHTFVALLLLGALFRQPTVQHLLQTVGLSLGQIRSMTHTAAIGSAAAMLIVGALWQQGRTFPWHIVVPALVVAVLLYSAVLYMIAWPATSGGVAVEELRSWRTALYMVMYALPTPLALVLVARTAIGHVRKRRERSRTLFGIAVLVCVVGSTADHATRALSGILLSLGVSNEFTDARSHSNDLLFLPILALMACLGIPSIVLSLRIYWGKDSASRHAKLLTGMWTTLRAAVSDVGVPDTHDIPVATDFVEQRMFIDIEDAVHALLPYYPKDGEDSSPQAAARELRDALNNMSRGIKAVSAKRTPPAWLQDDRQVLAVAAAWNEQEDHPEWIPT